MLTFFIGKGGVGKTTVSSAYALHLAARHPRRSILLLSTDPAHSLADVLKIKLSDKPKQLAASRLWARQLDPQKQIERFLRAEREQILTLLGKGSLFSRDELEPLLDTSLPGMAEVAALLAIHDLVDSEFDDIVVDTAPMGHAIRLFQMPEHFARFLDVLETAASRDVVLARHFGGRARTEPAVERWARMVERVKSALSAGESKLVLVTTPEPFSLKEAARSASSFSGGVDGHAIGEIVLNRVIETKTACPRCSRRSRQSQAARKFLQAHFPDTKVFRGEDPGGPILGVQALRSFGTHIFEEKRLSRTGSRKPAHAVRLKLEPASWPQLETSLTMTLGKGGVGKTTISAALAYHQRKTARKQAVSICSIDPAPSLDDVFATKVGDELRPVLGDRKLRAAEFDAMSAFQRWAHHLRTRLSDAMSTEQSGIHLDLSLDRDFLLALLDVVPPGIDEIFAIFRILDLVRSGERVIIDMAPTGHALEVLRTPARLLAWSRLLLKTLAAHRTLPIAQDAAVEVATLSQSVRDLAAMLRDGQRCQVIAVTLPEPLPDYETARLLRSLKEVDAPLSAVFINRVLLDEPGDCRRCKLAAEWQTVSLAHLQKQLRGKQIYVTAEFESEIAGREALNRFTQKLWRVKPIKG